MIETKNKIDCCGCNACSDICKQGAISYSVDQEGFWYPVIDSEKCNDCGACEKVCPILNVKDLKKNEFEQSECHAMVHKNLEIRFDSTSGGAFSALAQQMYKQGGYVGGAIWTQDWEVEHFISSNKDDLEKLRSSKYLQSNAQGFYKAVRQLLLQGEKVLVCGTPCQMAALRAFLRKSYDNLIIVDFICRGINSPKVWKKYLEYQEEKFGAKVVYIKPKNKELGWRKLTTKIVFKNGKTLYDTVDTSIFTQGYLRTNVYCRPSCYHCKFKGFPRIADITIADFWGAEKTVNKEFDNNLGTSLVMVNNTKGKKYYEQITSGILDTSIPFKSILKGNKALTEPLGSPLVDRMKFYNDLENLPFDEVADKYIKSNPQKLKFIAKGLRNFAIFTRDVIKASRFSIRTWSQNIWYNFFSSAVKTNIFKSKGYIIFYKYCALDIHRKAKIVLNGPFYFGCKRVKNSKLESRLLVEQNAKITVFNNFVLYYGADLEVFKGATLIIQGNGGANINSTIICGDHIEIGDGVMCGRNVTIRDNNGGHFMSLQGYKVSKPVIIGQHAWLCEGCTVMQGVKIGDGAIVGAHTLVTGKVPSFSLVSGNPMQIVYNNVYWKY